MRPRLKICYDFLIKIVFAESSSRKDIFNLILKQNNLICNIKIYLWDNFVAH
nr:MAG TPA: hypothetical protein [Caudoviricetes sp.]